MSAALIPASARALPLAVRARGARIFTADGRDYIDGSSGPLAANLGHGHPAMIEALNRQSHDLVFAHRAQFRNTPAERLAAGVAARLGEGFGRSSFVCGGSEAVELAMKLAHMTWAAEGRPEKHRFVSGRVSYHGNTLGAMNLSGQPRYSSAFRPLVHGEQTISVPQTYRLAVPDGETPARQALARLRAEFADLDVEHTAAVVFEGVGGSSSGVVVPPPGFFEELRSLCDEHDVLWICDEVMSGFGRTGTWFAFQHSGAVPDIVCFAKGIAGGYAPLGGVTVSDRVWERIAAAHPAVAAGHTFTNFPLNCAVGLAALDVIERERLLDRVTDRGRRLGQELTDLAREARIVGDVRGIGYMWGLEFTLPGTTEPFDPALDVTARAVATAAEHGLIVYPARLCAGDGRGDAVIVAPPLNATDDELEDLLSRLGDSLHSIRVSLDI
ncbi:aminotransferase class III-fold pyridoxal phosphate-dependent enzyme [Streptomyces sp. SID2888]|uniref:aminotransferase family protein n=1 Tax=Streptomyces sp. SID2888 TaxID=2690256 RepID=UPI001367A216|nr:aminotransferase class III-fold pyridoxal phosphate-dependent enzyme [Streptomyces sp. SID2888]MYV50760.1 aminotransferase class III-fold pyridoxal phosphate-dependent enzyme [Streptomyces sp. SID2888]